MSSLSKRAGAEFLGTFWLVFGGCASAVFCGSAIGLVGISFAFGLTVLTMAYAIGHISGCHLNPAVSLGLLLGGRFSAKDFVPYVIAQILGAIAGAGLLYFLVSGKAGGDATAALSSVSNGIEGSFDLTGAKYNLATCFIVEALMTFFFLTIILGSTDERAPKGFAPIAIGLGLTLIHFASAKVTNTSVNPARSLGTAIFAEGWALSQLWVFIAAPLLGGALAGIVSKCCCSKTCCAGSCENKKA